MLVLSGLGQDGSVTRAPTLPESQASGGEAGSVEEKNPGGVRVLLANPRWERRFVRFLELSGMGKTMAEGTDEESAHAARVG